MPVKQGVRILAIDDSSFSGSDEDALVVGVVGRCDTVEGVISFRVGVDGGDATKKIISKARRSRFSDQIKLLVLNGVTLAGLNIVDLDRVRKELHMPVASIVRRKPHSRELEKAMRAQGTGAKSKLALLRRLNSKFRISRHGGFYVQCAGISTSDFSRLQKSAVSMLRLAHIIANGVATGESKGRV